MALYSDSFGRPLNPHEVDLLRAMVERFLGPLDEPFMRAGMWASVADHYLRTMALLGVPLEQFLTDHPLPITFEQALQIHGLTDQHRQEIKWARDNAAIYVRGWRDDLKTNLVRAINAGVRGRMSGRDLSQVLSDHFAEINRDFTRIAETELAAATNNGMLAGQEPGQYVLGQSFPDACAWCRKNFHGKILEVIDPPLRGVADWDKQIWRGKSNVGRYQSRTERGTGRQREPWELWSPCAPAHPHCRCFLLQINLKTHTVNPETGRLELRPEIMANYRKRKKEAKRAIKITGEPAGVALVHAGPAK